MNEIKRREAKGAKIVIIGRLTVLWILSLFFLISAYGHLFVLKGYGALSTRVTLAGILFAFIGILFNPFLSKIIGDRIAFYPKGKLKTGILAMLLMVVYFVLP